MKNKKRKATIDDGMNPELVVGADFDDYFGIPIIKKPKEIVIPSAITPFSERNRIVSPMEAIGFNEMDKEFAEVLINPQIYVEEMKNKLFVSPEREIICTTPDCSLYRDVPFATAVTNVYRNRAIGYYFQKNGAYVIPQIRWGNELTYTTKVFPEKIAFLGAEKRSIVAIGTYGCIQHREDKYYFKAGLEAMLIEIEPVIVLVYGGMPDSIFGDYQKATRFVHYRDWTSRVCGGEQ